MSRLKMAYLTWNLVLYVYLGFGDIRISLLSQRTHFSTQKGQNFHLGVKAKTSTLFSIKLDSLQK